MLPACGYCGQPFEPGYAFRVRGLHRTCYSKVRRRGELDLYETTYNVTVKLPSSEEFEASRLGGPCCRECGIAVRLLVGSALRSNFYPTRCPHTIT